MIHTHTQKKPTIKNHERNQFLANIAVALFLSPKVNFLLTGCPSRWGFIQFTYQIKNIALSPCLNTGLSLVNTKQLPGDSVAKWLEFLLEELQHFYFNQCNTYTLTVKDSFQIYLSDILIYDQMDKFFIFCFLHCNLKYHV